MELKKPPCQLAGVYALINQRNQRAYVGSSIDLYKRVDLHMRALNNNNHYNKMLQDDYRGGDQFKVDLLYIEPVLSTTHMGLLRSELLAREQEAITELEAQILGYNIQERLTPLSTEYIKSIRGNLGHAPAAVIDHRGSWDHVVNQLGDNFDAEAGTQKPNSIKEVCEQFQISQSALARRFNIPLRTVQGWCLSERQPPVYIISMITELLQYDALLRGPEKE